MERNLRLLLSYDGTDFHGWQVQPGMRTVQGILKESLGRVMRHPITLVGSGRTDAGVHALGQVASVRTSCRIPSDNLVHAVGSRLPQDLVVRDVADVAGSFHAQHSSKHKLYRYRIHNARPFHDHLCRLSQLGKEVHFSAMEPQTDQNGRGTARSWDVGDSRAADPSVAVSRTMLTEYITRGLSREERLVLVLYYYEELTMSEIGSVLKLSESRVSQIHKDILQRLRQRFGSSLCEELVA